MNECLQSDLMIDDQVISSSDMLWEGTYFLPININYQYYVLQKKIINKNISFRTTINGNVKVICYDWNDVVPQCLRSISHNDYNTLSPLHTPMKEHDIIMGENNRIKVIEFDIPVSIRTQDTTYG